MRNIRLILQFNCKKALIGTLLGLVSLAILGFGYSVWDNALIFLSCFILVGSIRINSTRKRTDVLLGAFWILLLLFYFVLLPYYEIFSDNIGFMMHTYTQVSALLISAMFIFLLLTFICGMTGELRTSVLMWSMLLFCYVIVNGYIFRFRGKELIFADLLSLKTAANVAGNYDYTPQIHSIYELFVLVLLLFTGYCVTPSVFQKKKSAPSGSRFEHCSCAVVFCCAAQYEVYRMEP